MSPLHAFIDIAKALSEKPMSFWSSEEQKNFLLEVSQALDRLKKVLEKKKMEETEAYQKLVKLESLMEGSFKDEYSFIQTLEGLVGFYNKAPTNSETRELVLDLGKEISAAKKRILEFRLALTFLKESGKNKNEEQKRLEDLKRLSEVGFGYVLEYTLQVLLEFTRVSEDEKNKLLKEGLTVEAGNLPAYLPLEKSFRNELCLKVFDPELKKNLLAVFYDFEEVLTGEDISKIAPALKEFDLSLLEIFKQKGIKDFKALFYAPFGKELTIDQLILEVKKIIF